jgi:hypothetical protein
MVVDEVGWQTTTTGYTGYVNDENVKTIDEATQTSYLKTMARKYFACDPAIVSVQLFLLVDEPYRNGRTAEGVSVGGGWQSGLITTGGEGKSKPKQAYSQVASDFSAGRAACQGSMINWQPKGGTGNGGGSGGSGGGAAKGGATVGSPDGIIDPSTLSGFQSTLNTLAAGQASLPAGPWSLSSSQGVLNQLLNAMGTRPGALTGTVSIRTCSSCTLNGTLNGLYNAAVARSLSHASAAAKTVATAKLSAAAGGKAKAKLKSLLKKGAKAPAGKYFLVVVAQSSADATKKYGAGVQLRSVKAKAAKPVKKKKK